MLYRNTRPDDEIPIHPTRTEFKAVMVKGGLRRSSPEQKYNSPGMFRPGP